MEDPRYLTLIVLTTLFLVICFTKWVTLKLTRSKQINVGPFQSVPIVESSLPIVGHGIEFSRDMLGFMKRCCEKYGKVFQIQMYRVKMIIICDRNLASEYFKSTEDKLSLYSVLENLYFGYGFSDEPNFINNFIVPIIKKSIGIRYDEFVPKITSEAQHMIQRLKDQCSKSKVQGSSRKTTKIDLTKEMMRFVSNTSAQCFISIGLPEHVFETLLEFAYLLNKIIVTTFYLPTWLLRFVIGWRVKQLRNRLVQFLMPEIEKYIEDKDKSDSLVLRTAVDFVDEKSGRSLPKEEIGSILVCLLYVSTENTALGLTNTLIDLVLNSSYFDAETSDDYWKQIRVECEMYLGNEDSHGIFNSPLLNACIMESARLNTHMFGLSRKPIPVGTTIGNYFIGNQVDFVSFCPPLIMVHGEDSYKHFKSPLKYNPNRFLPNHGSDNKHQNNQYGQESWSSYNVMTWGAGLHVCPGKTFALYEIKMAIALIVSTFKMELQSKSNKGKGPAPAEIPELNYFSPSAFAERHVNMNIELI